MIRGAETSQPCSENKLANDEWGDIIIIVNKKKRFYFGNGRRFFWFLYFCFEFIEKLEGVATLLWKTWFLNKMKIAKKYRHSHFSWRVRYTHQLFYYFFALDVPLHKRHSCANWCQRRTSAPLPKRYASICHGRTLLRYCESSLPLECECGEHCLRLLFSSENLKLLFLYPHRLNCDVNVAQLVWSIFFIPPTWLSTFLINTPPDYRSSWISPRFCTL